MCRHDLGKAFQTFSSTLQSQPTMKLRNNIDPSFLASVLVGQHLSRIAKMNLAVFQPFLQLAQNLATPEHLLGDNT